MTISNSPGRHICKSTACKNRIVFKDFVYELIDLSLLNLLLNFLLIFLLIFLFFLHLKLSFCKNLIIKKEKKLKNSIKIDLLFCILCLSFNFERSI